MKNNHALDLADSTATPLAAAIKPDMSQADDQKVGVKPIKRVVFKYMQPAFLLAILAFWSFSPERLTNHAWTAIVSGYVIKIAIMSMEWINERHAHWRLTVREFLDGAFYFVMNKYVLSSITAIIIYDPLKGLVKKHDLVLGIAKEFPLALQVIILIVAAEFVQYWFHRLMHSRDFLWEIHAPHHFITQMNTLNSGVGNLFENMFLGLSLGIFFDMPLVAVICAGQMGGSVSAFAHSNIRFDPPRWYSFLFTTIEHHSLHHSLNYDETRCNFANELILFDRMFGTYSNGEAVHVGQDNQRRLSIWEQQIWPVRHSFAKLKARVRRAQTLAEPKSDISKA